MISTQVVGGTSKGGDLRRLRRGVDVGFSRPLAGASASTRYIGLQAWHCGLGYMLLVWILFPVLFILTWIDLWIQLGNYVSEAIQRYALATCEGTFGDSVQDCVFEAVTRSLLNLITFTLLMTLFQVAMLSYITCRKDTVTRRRWLSWPVQILQRSGSARTQPIS